MRVPEANVSWTESAMLKHRHADVGVAVSIPGGLITPIVRAAETKTLSAISAEVKDMAAQMKDAQRSEIETMTGWLEEWDEPVPGMRGMPGMEGMPGMADPARMHQLEQAQGVAFDRMFLEMMIPHHEGAIEMAQTEQAQGSYTPATDLAGEMVTSQRSEIDTMRGLLQP